MQEVRGSNPRPGGLRVSQFQAIGGVSTLQSGASGFQSTMQGIPSEPKSFPSQTGETKCCNGCSRLVVWSVNLSWHSFLCAHMANMQACKRTVGSVFFLGRSTTNNRLWTSKATIQQTSNKQTQQDSTMNRKARDNNGSKRTTNHSKPDNTITHDNGRQ